jgi:hypothetical protein
LVFFQGAIYDASYAGLFKTQTDELVDDRQIGSLESIEGRLLIVPHGINPKELDDIDYISPRLTPDGKVLIMDPTGFRFKDSFTRSNAGSLIDALTKEVIMYKVVPFDGSGYCPGRHVISKGKIYVRHGNYPNERITITNMRTQEESENIHILTSNGFIVHNGLVYDKRVCEVPGSDKRRVRMLRSDEAESATAQSLYNTKQGERISGLASAGSLGLLIALHDENTMSAKIISHSRPGNSLLRSEGILYLAELKVIP